MRQGLRLPGADAADRPRRRARLPADHVRPRAERDHLPGVPRRPRQGAGPFVDDGPMHRRRARPHSCAGSGSASTGCCPTRSSTSTSARTTAGSPARSCASSARCARRCRTSRSRSTPSITPDDLIEDAVRTVFETGKPHFVNHPMMVGDHGEGYAAVSCYNSLKIGGGRPHAGAAQPEGGGAAAHGRCRRVPRRHPAPLRRADRRAGRGPRPLAGRAAALLRHALAGHRGTDRPRPVLGDVRRSSASPSASTC